MAGTSPAMTSGMHRTQHSKSGGNYIRPHYRHGRVFPGHPRLVVFLPIGAFDWKKAATAADMIEILESIV
jgi:hypothetical protein